MNDMSLRNNQSGSVLLDGLVAILIFSVGILGMVAMQGISVKLTTDSKSRSDAAMLADKVVAQMWGVATSSTRLATFATDGTCAATAYCYATWLAEVEATLPNVSATTNKPTIAFTADGATISLFWKSPNDTTAHTYVTIAPVVM